MLALFGKKNESVTISLDDHINAFKTNLTAYNILLEDIIKSSSHYHAPEFEFDGIPVSYMSCQKAIEATEQRIQILQAIKEGKPISKDEQNLLMKVTECKNNPLVNQYPNIMQTPSHKP